MVDMMEHHSEHNQINHELVWVGLFETVRPLFFFVCFFSPSGYTQTREEVCAHTRVRRLKKDKRAFYVFQWFVWRNATKQKEETEGQRRGGLLCGDVSLKDWAHDLENIQWNPTIQLLLFQVSQSRTKLTSRVDLFGRHVVFSLVLRVSFVCTDPE